MQLKKLQIKRNRNAKQNAYGTPQNRIDKEYRNEGKNANEDINIYVSTNVNTLKCKC